MHFISSSPMPRERTTTLQRLALEPARALRVERVQVRTFETWHVSLHFVADLALQISEMEITFRETLEQILIERELGGRIDWIEAISFISEPAQHQSPAAATILEEIVEAPGADHVANDAVDRRALRDRHFGLRDRAVACDIDGAAAEKVQDAHAARPALVVGGDELLERALKPRRHHATVG